MSQMGQFVFECQEIAESNYNERKEVVIAEVEKTFIKRPQLISMAMTATLDHWKEIQSDMGNYF